MSKRTLLLVAGLIVVVLCVAIYRSRIGRSRLNVTPEAAKEIEKAKRR